MPELRCRIAIFDNGEKLARRASRRTQRSNSSSERLAADLDHLASARRCLALPAMVSRSSAKSAAWRLVWRVISVLSSRCLSAAQRRLRHGEQRIRGISHRANAAAEHQR